MIGRTISHYRIVEKLGAGGMGQVYKAVDLRLDRPVALKFLSPYLGADATEKRRFAREAKAASALDHPHICTVYDVGETDAGEQYIAMAYYEGESLRERLRRGPLPLRTALDLGVQLAKGLCAAHRQGILHRDVKPANVVVTSDGTAKLLDFGLARLVDQARLTESGAGVGTIAYMAPEQLRGEAADHRSDLFALGILLYEMVAGRHPFRNGSGRTVAYAIVHETPDPLRTHRPDAPVALERILTRALANHPDDRYGDVSDLLADLQALDPAETSAPAPVTKSRSERPRYAVPAVLAALFLLAGIALVGLLLRDTPEAPIDRIAVLPLIDLTGRAESELFADQMTEALITELAKIEALRVTSRTSSMMYRNARKPAADIAAELGVSGLVEGSVVREGDRVRVTAQLIDARADRHLWAEDFDRDMDDVLALQADIARSIAQAIRIELTPTDEERLDADTDVDPEVYRLYLLGRKYREMETREGMEKAREYLRRAIALDSTYAPAVALLAKVIPRSEAKWRMLERAKRLDPPQALVYSIISDSLERVRDWAGAEAAHLKALELDPNSKWAHHEYSYMLRRVGRLDEALEHARRAAELDPLSRLEANSVGSVYMLRREYGPAVEQYQKAIELSPEDPRSHMLQALSYAWLGQEEVALDIVERHLAEQPYPHSLYYMYAKIKVLAIVGRRAEARALFEQHRAETLLLDEDLPARVGHMREAQIRSLLGDTDRALDLLEAEAGQGYAFISWYLKASPVYDNLRDDPRFTEVLKTVGLYP